MKIILIWNGNRDELSPRRKDEGDSFQQHDECMTRFRLAHPGMETVGLKDAEVEDFMVSIPIRKTKLAKYARN